MKIKCTKDFLMDDGEVAFVAGMTYEFTISERGEYVTNEDEQGEVHFMSEDNMRDITE